jgi:hypothetical protein
MDGTLVDTEPYWMAAETPLVESFGGTWSHEQALRLVGLGLEDSARIFQDAGGHTRIVEDLLRHAASKRRILLPHRIEPRDDRMRWIDLEVMLRHTHFRPVLLHRLHDAPHARRHELVRIHHHRGAVHEALRGADFTDLVAKCFLEPGSKCLRGVLRQRAILLRAEVQVCLLREPQHFAVELAQVFHHEFVPRIVEEQHLELPLLEHLEIRARFRGRAIRREQTINLLLL